MKIFFTKVRDFLELVSHLLFLSLRFILFIHSILILLLNFNFVIIIFLFLDDFLILLLLLLLLHQQQLLLLYRAQVMREVMLCLLHHLLLEHFLLLGLSGHGTLLLFPCLHASTASCGDELLLVRARDPLQSIEGWELNRFRWLQSSDVLL